MTGAGLISGASFVLMFSDLGHRPGNPIRILLLVSYSNLMKKNILFFALLSLGVAFLGIAFWSGNGPSPKITNSTLAASTEKSSTIRPMSGLLSPTTFTSRTLPALPEERRRSPQSKADEPESVEPDMVVDLEPGVLAPLVLLNDENAPPMSPIVARLAREIATDFSQEVREAIQSANDPSALQEKWEVSREKADERFQKLFGDEEAIRRSIVAGREALQSN